jgi:hypothetical protein
VVVADARRAGRSAKDKACVGADFSKTKGTCWLKAELGDSFYTRTRHRDVATERHVCAMNPTVCFEFLHDSNLKPAFAKVQAEGADACWDVCVSEESCVAAVKAGTKTHKTPTTFCHGRCAIR